MSLVTSASPWISDDTINKKRPSTMRKQRPVMHSVGQNNSEPEEYHSQSENYQNIQPSSINDIENASQDRNTRVNELLNKITSADTTNDNSKLGNFNPPSPPSLNVKKDMDNGTSSTANKQYVPPPTYFTNSPNSSKPPSYGADDIKSGTYSNYSKSYEPPAKIVNQPYYAKMGLGGGIPSDDKLMEKINYMIHLLEEQQHEKTNNITEEFILYTALGVFIIFVVDSFSRSGKYIR